jgi:hypothetical protein
MRDTPGHVTDEKSLAALGKLCTGSRLASE